MKQTSEFKKISILLLLLIVPGVVLIFLSKADHKFEILPYYGEKEALYAAGVEVPDTMYHRVPDFALANQEGEEVSFSDFEGKIIVADFFFTTCPTICPIMTKQMTRLQWLLEDNSYDDVHFLSYTVNPENDTPEVLKSYALDQGADLNKWTFLTGDQKAIFELGFEGYLLSTQEDELAPGGFLHSSMFVLLDRDRHIRGFYDGTSTKEVDDLVTDIKMLKKQEVMRPSEIVRK
jgi:protein SCO1/2